MSVHTFLALLQTLITLTHDDSTQHSAMGALKALFCLLLRSEGHPQMIRLVGNAIRIYPELIEHREEYAGHPGDHAANERKKKRLFQTIVPFC